jgi:hypothetical protein
MQGKTDFLATVQENIAEFMQFGAIDKNIQFPKSITKLNLFTTQ